MNYKSYKEQKAKDEQKAFEEIKGIFTFFAYVLRFRTKEALIFIAIILLAIIILQWQNFDFTVLKFK